MAYKLIQRLEEQALGGSPRSNSSYPTHPTSAVIWKLTTATRDLYPELWSQNYAASAPALPLFPPLQIEVELKYETLAAKESG